MQCDAVISDCGRYRYSLTRRWDDEAQPALFIMLNPSTADALQDDPTIRSCTRLSKHLGFGGLEVVNLFAWRATNPKELPLPPSKAVGSGNAEAIERALSRTTKTICAWGAHPYASRAAPAALDIIGLNRGAAYCFGVTKSGAPKHPLYIKTGTPLAVFKTFANQETKA